MECRKSLQNDKPLAKRPEGRTSRLNSVAHTLPPNQRKTLPRAFNSLYIMLHTLHLEA